MVDTEKTKLSSVPARIVDGTLGNAMRSTDVEIEAHYKVNDAKRPKTTENKIRKFTGVRDAFEGPTAVDDARYEGVFGNYRKRGKRVKRTSD